MLQIVRALLKGSPWPGSCREVCSHISNFSVAWITHSCLNITLDIVFHSSTSSAEIFGSDSNPKLLLRWSQESLRALPLSRNLGDWFWRVREVQGESKCMRCNCCSVQARIKDALFASKQPQIRLTTHGDTTWKKVLGDLILNFQVSEVGDRARQGGGALVREISCS